MALCVRPATEQDVKAIARVLMDFAGVRCTRERCRKVAQQLVREAVRSRRRRELRDFAFVACAGAEVRGLAAGAWCLMHGLFEDVRVMQVTHLGGQRGVLLPLLRHVRSTACVSGASVLVCPVTQPPYTTTPEAGRRLEQALDKLGWRPVGTAWAMGG